MRATSRWEKEGKGKGGKERAGRKHHPKINKFLISALTLNGRELFVLT